MIKFKFLTALLFFASFILSCNPNDDDSYDNSSTKFSKNFGESVARDFIGQVVDVQNNPIKNATVTIGNSIVETDRNGVFLINDAFVFKKFAHIKVAKSGYVDGSRSMVPTSGKNRVTIMLMTSYDNTQYIESGVRSEVSMYNGTKIVFDGAFQDEFGRNYSGTVQVAPFHLTPSDDNLSSLMPGMLYAEDKNGQEKVLETYGMLNVELYGSNGQKLQITTGHTAEISLRIDDAQLATAPNSIPLWHFDEEKGYWKEEGVAERQGNFYVGKVSHFSWWNLNISFPTVNLTVTIVDTNGNPLENIDIILERNGMGDSRLNRTDENGQISGLIPSNETLTLDVYDCGTIIYTTAIGPFSTDTVLPTITVANFQAYMVTGNLLKCDNAIVTNGYVYFKSEHKSIYTPVINGLFTINISDCVTINDFYLQGFDFDSLKQTEISNYTFAGTNMNVGNLQTCTAINEYVTCKIDNNAIITYIQSNNTILYVRRSGLGFTFEVDKDFLGGLPLIRISAPTTNLGTFNSPPYILSGNDLPTRNINTQMPNTLSFNLTNFGNIGEFVDLTANGSFYDTLGIQHTIQLTAHVIRMN